jgi:tellurite resistance-related uncharacterized protein
MSGTEFDLQCERDRPLWIAGNVPAVLMCGLATKGG